MGISKRLLDRYEWWKMTPHPEWVKDPWSVDNPLGAHAAGIPGKLRMIYWPCAFSAGTVQAVEPGARYRALLFNPVNGEQTDLGSVAAEENGDWPLPLGAEGWRVMPIYQDWVLVMEAEPAERAAPE